MKISHVSTAAFLAGATTLAVSLPAMGEEREFKHRDFDEVQVTAGLSAEIEIGKDFSVSAEAPSRRALRQLDISVRNGKLIVDRDSSWMDYSLFSGRHDATVHITLPVLKAVSAKAGSDVHVSGDYGTGLSAQAKSGSDLTLDDINGGQFSFRASSGSDIVAQGVCDSLDANSSSGSDIKAEALKCSAVEARASSGSDMEVTATQTVEASASSGGDIRISGSPTSVEKRESSGGDVRLAN